MNTQELIKNVVEGKTPAEALNEYDPHADISTEPDDTEALRYHLAWILAFARMGIRAGLKVSSLEDLSGDFMGTLRRGLNIEALKKALGDMGRKAGLNYGTDIDRLAMQLEQKLERRWVSGDLGSRGM